jgi:hypothetical protein
MQRTYTYAAAILASIAFVGLVGAVPMLQPSLPSDTTFDIRYVQTGGFAGVNNTLHVDASGGAMHYSRFGASFVTSLAPYEFSHLKQVLGENVGKIQHHVFQPKSGAADFFSYGLTIKIGNHTTQLSWVDEWASSDTLPAH